MENRIVNKNKLLCYSNKYFLFSRGTRLYISKAAEEAQAMSVSFPASRSRKILGSFRLMARALRLEPRCGIFVDDKIALISYHGGIYRVDCEKGSIELEHRFRTNMNNPLCFTRIEGVNGFEDGIYYGEYFLNHAREEVKIYRRNEDATWSVVYTFPAGSIFHIHGLVPCPENDCVYILTGDKDNESKICEARNSFKDVKIIVEGKQAYRSCVALPVKKGLLYTTDTPLEENFVYQLDFDTKEIEPIASISGPCIYGKVISENEMIFSTSVEPDSRITGLRYEFTYKLGMGVKDRKSHLYYVKYENGETQVKEIFSANKDLIPMGAGQFGTIMFPEGRGRHFITCQALRKFDNKTVEIDI